MIISKIKMRKMQKQTDEKTEGEIDLLRRVELDLSIRKISTTSHKIVDVNRSEIVQALQDNGIPFDIVKVEFAYYGVPSNSGSSPYRFLLNKLIGDDVYNRNYQEIKSLKLPHSMPDKIGIKDNNGNRLTDFPLKDFIYGDNYDPYHSWDTWKEVFGDMKPESMDDTSMQLYKAGMSSINITDEGSVRFDNERLKCGIVLHLLGDKRTPEQVLEEHLQKQGYPVSLTYDWRLELKWNDEIKNPFEDPALNIDISVAPHIFGEMSEKQKDRGKQLAGIGGRHAFNFNEDKPVSNFMLWALDIGRPCPNKAEDKYMHPYFYTGPEGMLPDQPIDVQLGDRVREVIDPIKAREIVDLLTMYIRSRNHDDVFP